MSFHLSVMPEQAIIRSADASKPTKRRVDDTNHPKVVLDYNNGATQYAYFRLPLPPQDEVGAFDSDAQIDIQYVSASALTGNVQFGVKYAIVDLAEGQDKALSSEVASTTSSYTGNVNTHYGVSFTLTGVFSGLNVAKRYVLVLQLTRKAPASDLAADVSVVGGVCRLISRAVPLQYENPILPQFSRWSPEIYLPFDGDIEDASGKAHSMSLFGPEACTFASDSPFGSGQCLQVNPDAIGTRNSGVQIPSTANIEMSLGTYPLPWSFGFWFKSSGLPTVSFGVLQTLNPWNPNGKGFQIINTTGRLQLYQYGSSNYEPVTTNLCDGSWHHILVSYPRYVLGVPTIGSVWIDGALVAPAAASGYFNAPPITPSIKVIGCDTVGTYLLSDFWYSNSTPPNDLASLLYNSGSGRRYNKAGLL